MRKRKFGGKWYSLFIADIPTRQEADKIAAVAREGGHLARVVKGRQGRYNVYSARK